MRLEIVKVRFICEGTYMKDDEDEDRLCSCDMTIEDTPAMIEHRYREAGWGYIDTYGIRHLCNRKHNEERLP